MRAGRVPLIFVAFGAISVAPVFAHQVFANTFLTIEGTSGPESDMRVFGTLASPRRACLDQRRVKLIANLGVSSPSRLADVAYSSRNGAWAARGDFSSDGGHFKAVVPFVKRGGEGHKHACGRDEVRSNE